MLLLYADDDPDDVMFFQEAAKIVCAGCKVVVAANGIDAINVLNILKPNFIFLDINMPVMNGVETLRLIKLDERLGGIPVCLFSTSITPEEKERYISMGAANCMVKPDRFEECCRVLRQVLQQPATLGV